MFALHLMIRHQSFNCSKKRGPFETGNQNRQRLRHERRLSTSSMAPRRAGPATSPPGAGTLRSADWLRTIAYCLTHDNKVICYLK